MALDQMMLDVLACEGLLHAHDEDGEIFFEPKCHDGAPTHVSYSKDTGLLHVYCAAVIRRKIQTAYGLEDHTPTECGEEIATFQIAKGEHPEFAFEGEGR